MSEGFLKARLQALCEGDSTLLWLEGSRTERVMQLRYHQGKLVLQLADDTTRVITFEKYAVTKVGLQFWSQGRPGVLYRWDAVPDAPRAASDPPPPENGEPQGPNPDDPPPHFAA